MITVSQGILLVIKALTLKSTNYGAGPVIIRKSAAIFLKVLHCKLAMNVVHSPRFLVSKKQLTQLPVGRGGILRVVKSLADHLHRAVVLRIVLFDAGEFPIC